MHYQSLAGKFASWRGERGGRQDACVSWVLRRVDVGPCRLPLRRMAHAVGALQSHAAGEGGVRLMRGWGVAGVRMRSLNQ